LSLKHLGGLLEAGRDPAAALKCYVAAAALDSGDVVLWRCLARLAVATRKWGLARLGLEQGLLLSAKHPLLLEDLMELLLAVGDERSCEAVARHLLTVDATHPRALTIVQQATAVSSLGDANSSLGDANSSLGDANSSLGDANSSLGDAKSSLGDAKSSLGGAKSSLRGAKSSLGDAKSSLRGAKSSLGDAKSSLGDAKSSLGDAKSSLGDVAGECATAAAHVPWRVPARPGGGGG
jgi:hypothetical protein